MSTLKTALYSFFFWLRLFDQVEGSWCRGGMESDTLYGSSPSPWSLCGLLLSSMLWRRCWWGSSMCTPSCCWGRISVGSLWRVSWRFGCPGGLGSVSCGGLSILVVMTPLRWSWLRQSWAVLAPRTGWLLLLCSSWQRLWVLFSSRWWG